MFVTFMSCSVVYVHFYVIYKEVLTLPFSQMYPANTSLSLMLIFHPSWKVPSNANRSPLSEGRVLSLNHP